MGNAGTRLDKLVESDQLDPLDMAEVARLEELRQARGLAEIAPEWRNFSGGIAGRAVPGVWLNYAVGCGLSGPLDDAAISELDDLVAWWTSAGIEPRVEVAPYADPTLQQALAERGFTVRMFETVFVRALDAAVPAATRSPAPHALVMRPIRRDDEQEVDSFALTSASGFFAPGAPIPEASLDVIRRCARHERVTAIIAELVGELVGAGAIDISGEIAGLFGASVRPEFRRRGIQQAMLAWRLNLAAERGARIATISGRPGEGTERNVRRMGFEVAYTKVVLCLPGEGLVRVKG